MGMQNGKFEIGDLVERTIKCFCGMTTGDKSVVTGFNARGFVLLDDYIGSHNPKNLKLVDPKFNLKTQTWFIRTETPEHRIAVQEWLFEQGMEWESRGKELIPTDYTYLTNTFLSSVVSSYILHGDGETHPSAQEIKLTYKTTVTDVVYPDVESERDKEIKAIRKEQEALAARLKALEVGS